MDKKTLQEKELNKVSGGDSESIATICHECQKRFVPNASDGTYLMSKDGCFGYTHYNICPYCGNKQKVSFL